MKLIVDNTGISTESLFGLVWIGYVFGVATMFIIAVIIALPILLLGWLFGSSDAVWTISYPADWWGIFSLLLVPIGLAWQGVITALIILFGLWIYRKFWAIEVQRAEE